jgi:hypothetical protein
MKKHHRVENVRFEGENLVLTVDGKEMSFSLYEVSPTFAKATDKERNAFEVSPSGYGIHWPLLDEDISIDGLLGITHAPPRKEKKTPASATPATH